MKKEDYMKLPKERLAELLAERDNPSLATPQIQHFPPGTPLCPYGGACINKFRDCMNCPGVITDEQTRIIPTTTSLTKEQLSKK